MKIWNEICNLDTIQYSDSSEISPDKKFCINCCYQLDESSKNRTGSVQLIKLEDHLTKIVSTHENIDGILDSCWISNKEFLLCGASGSLYHYSSDEFNMKLENKIEIDNKMICLSVDFYRNTIITSTSQGEVVLLDMNKNILFRHMVHNFEAWVSYLSRHHESLFFSGGDDCKCYGIDFRVDKGKIFSKTFDMGCTSIQSHPSKSNIFSTGGYDEILRIWDLRNMHKPIRTFNIGGGIWRHKWCPEGESLVLVAGMYSGFCIVETDSESDYLIYPNETSHKDGLAYGADWCRNQNDYLICTSSFYDHRWSLSKFSRF